MVKTSIQRWFLQPLLLSEMYFSCIGRKSSITWGVQRSKPHSANLMCLTLSCHFSANSQPGPLSPLTWRTLLSHYKICDLCPCCPAFWLSVTISTLATGLHLCTEGSDPCVRAGNPAVQFPALSFKATPPPPLWSILAILTILILCREIEFYLPSPSGGLQFLIILHHKLFKIATSLRMKSMLVYKTNDSQGRTRV